jgi:hypothetical protein
MDKDVLVIGDASLLEEQKSDVVTLVEGDAENALPKHAKLNDDGTVTLPLFVPTSIKYQAGAGGVVKEDSFSEFTMRRFNGGDMEIIQSVSSSKSGYTAIAISAGIARPLFNVLAKKMDGADLQAASDVVIYFLKNGPRTGRSS